MAHYIFSSKPNFKILPKLLPKPRSFSVSENLARYGASVLCGVEHLTLLVRKESVAIALIRHLVRSRLWPALPFMTAQWALETMRSPFFTDNPEELANCYKGESLRNMYRGSGYLAVR